MLTALVVALSSLASAGTSASLMLAVPYLPQTDALCGGAAAAMVFRYWGDVHADVEQFAPLVDRRAGGIADDVLVKAIEERGWRTLRFAGSVEQLGDHIRNGRPVVILVADRGTSNHYVLVTGVEADAILVHDPTWGPSRRIAFADLMRTWAPTKFWSLLILPGEAGEGTSAADGPQAIRREAARAPTAECARLLDAGIDEAADGAPAAAYTIIERVRLQCPREAGPLRELAGVRFAESRWPDAAALAERALALDAGDSYAWDLLASSRFMQDDAAGALRAWNRIGKPLINLVQIDGIARARFQTLSSVLGLKPNMLLTEEAFRLAERRLGELPDRAASRLTFRPEPDGFVTVKATILERTGPPQGAIAWTAAALETAVDREARATIPGTTGQGEVWSAGWRWWNGRPRIAVGFAAPGLGRVWEIDAAFESQTYADGANSALETTFDETRAHAGLSLSGWLSADVRYSVTGGIDSWQDTRTLFTGGSIERRWLDDRWSARATATAWMPAGYFKGGLRAAFQSSRAAEGWIYLADAGAERANDAAPLAIWAGAGDGHARDLLLRAHPLVKDGAIDLTGPAVFGRTLSYAHAEIQRWLASPGPVRVGLAAFADAARASRRRSLELGSVAHLDLGAGLRMRIPGSIGTLRVDYAHGVGDNADALTLGWQF